MVENYFLVSGQKARIFSPLTEKSRKGPLLVNKECPKSQFTILGYTSEGNLCAIWPILCFSGQGFIMYYFPCIISTKHTLEYILRPDHAKLFTVHKYWLIYTDLKKIDHIIKKRQWIRPLIIVELKNSVYFLHCKHRKLYNLGFKDPKMFMEFFILINTFFFEYFKFPIFKSWILVSYII